MGLVTGISLGLAALSTGVGIANAEKAKKKARGQERDAKTAATAAVADQKQASAALARMEQESMVPGFGDSNYIPGYKGSAPSFSDQANSTFSLGNPTIYSPDGIAMGSMFKNQPQPAGGTLERFDDFTRDDRGEPVLGFDQSQRGVIDQIKKQINFKNGRVNEVNVTSRNKQQALNNELLKRRFNEVTRSLPKTAQGKPIFQILIQQRAKDFMRHCQSQSLKWQAILKLLKCIKEVI